MRCKGISLIEVMIAVAIVAILSAIAVPTYNSYIASSRRNEAKMSLLELSQFMERYYTSHGSYSGATLPYYYIPNDGRMDYYYSVVLSASGATFSITLYPEHVMQTDFCGRYSIDQTGAHSPSTAECW